MKQSIDTYAREQSKSKKYGSVTLLQSPIFELDFWRIRTQTLTSLVEQLQSAEIRKVFSVLTASMKATTSSRRTTGQNQVIHQSLQDWKELNGQLTEATIESKDNCK